MGCTSLCTFKKTTTRAKARITETWITRTKETGITRTKETGRTRTKEKGKGKTKISW